MTLDEKVRLAHSLWVAARQIAAAGVRARHPDWSDEHNDTATRGDVYPAGTDELQAWAFQHRVVRRIDGEAVQFAPV